MNRQIRCYNYDGTIRSVYNLGYDFIRDIVISESIIVVCGLGEKGIKVGKIYGETLFGILI